MPEFAMAVIDGTGPWSNETYKSAMKDSFCSQLGAGLQPNVNYERGPSSEGYRIRERSARAVSFLRNADAEKIMIAGYSRGGSAAVIAASMLEKLGRNVDYLFLFDPVDRHLSGNTDAIPGNVKEAWIARRKIGAPEMEKYDHSLQVYQGGHNPVRNWFGTTATKFHSSVIVEERKFLGSHGALGGVGWAHVKEDPMCQLEVAAFMNKGLTKAGVKFRLSSVNPTS